MRLVCADDGVPVKPAPDMVLHLCAATGVAPERTAVVGDSTGGHAMGRAAGAGLVIGVLTGVGERTDLEPLADIVVGSVDTAWLVAAAHEPKHKQEDVDEVQVELERADDGRLLHRAGPRGEVAGLDALDVVGGQGGEEHDPDERDRPGDAAARKDS